MLKIGDKIPQDVKILNEDGEQTTLSNYLGKYLVIYFYPGDFTPTCTKEACSIRDANSELNIEKEFDAKILGISSDSPEKHLKFKDKYNLNFELLSDESKDLQNAFGVWGEKSMFGRIFMGTMRKTFIVDPSGVIVFVWDKVDSGKHGEQVYNKLKELQKA